MGCNCGKSKASTSGITQTFQVRYADGQVRNYMSAGEADAAVAASANTPNPGTRTN